MDWKVELTGKAKKADKFLSQEAGYSFATLLKEMELIGPYRKSWPNYSKLKGKKDIYHCHLKKGNPTYVACWRIVDKKNKKMEVFYAGTHENAPY